MNGWGKAIIGTLLGALLGAGGMAYQQDRRITRLETQMVEVQKLPEKIDELNRSIGQLNTNIDLLRQRLNRLDPEGRS